MFEINVIAPEFKGLNIVKQHRIINEVRVGIKTLRHLNITIYNMYHIYFQVLKEEIKDMHGIRIYTSIPDT